MTFFLGTHEPCWLSRTDTPLFVSRPRLARYRQLPTRSAGPWALDSGAFSQITTYGAWTLDAPTYAAEVRSIVAAVGDPEFVAPQDWMCEPSLLARTGLSVAEHQARTVKNFIELRRLAPEVPWCPVLQGWTVDDYRRCTDAYSRAAVDLAREPIVGLGTVCRRQDTEALPRIASALWGLPLHGFGVKVTGLALAADLLQSADSMAWSFHARKRPPLPGCSHRSCANCMRYALHWRDELLRSLAGHQRSLFQASEWR